MYTILFLFFSSLTISLNLPQQSPLDFDNNKSEIKIINKKHSEENAYPYHVGILPNCPHCYCSGSLITENMVLTSATCAELLQDCSHGELYFGYNNLFSQTNSENQQVIAFNNILIHENFSTDNNNGKVNDIAIIELEHKVELNSVVQTIVLDASESDHSNQNASFTGWDNTDSLKPSNLTYTQNLVISYRGCRNVSAILKSIIVEIHICLADSDNEKISGFGDFGSPLVVEGIQVGIGSFLQDSVSVFTRITKFESWIKNKCPDCKFEKSNSNKNQISWFLITAFLLRNIFQS